MGQDMAGLGARKVAVYTDPHLASLPPVQQVLDSLVRNKVSIRSIAARASCNHCNLNLFNKVNFVLYDEVRVEPTDQSFVAAADFAKREQGRSYFYISSVVCIYYIITIFRCTRSSSLFSSCVLQVDAFLAVGGGSVMDTAKAANLYSSDPGAELLDYVNTPIGGHQRESLW